MLSKREIKKIQQALPLNISHGYELIKEKLPDLSKDQISKAFTVSNRYRPDVIDAALEVIAEYERKVQEQKEKVKSLKISRNE